jgi:TonB-dependent receptor
VASVSLSVGGNDAVLGRTLDVAPSVGSEWLGAAGDARALPAGAAAAGDLGGLSQTDLNGIIGSFRNAWSARRESGRGQLSLGVSTGGEMVALGAPLGFLGSFTYSTGQEVRANEQRAVAIHGGTADSTIPQNAYRGSTATAGVLWGGLLNLSARVGDATKLSFNNTYTRSGDNQATRLAGQNEEFAETFDVTRLSFTARSALSSQLAGEHMVGGRHGLTWAGTWSQVRRYEPDRSDLVYQTAIDPGTGASIPLAWWGAPRSATRTFSDLDERGLDLKAALMLRLGVGPRSLTVKMGGGYRRVDRDADTRVFDISSIGLDEAQRAQPAEAIFGGSYAEAGLLTVFADANAGRYTANDRIGAAFAQIELPLASRLRIIGGARAEQWDLELLTTTVGGAAVPVSRRRTDVLPALALALDLAGSQVLRLSATQTLARPEYRELSPVNYRDVLGGLTVFGNPALERSLIQNFDARWEWYPGPGELVSLGAFAKRFERPIEKVLVATTGANALSFVNALAAYNYGVELEVRKNLINIAPALAPFSVFANATLMRSEIRPGNDSVSSLTSDERPMVGQAPYVVNAGILFTSPRGISATLLYNVVGRRIVEAGSFPLPDTYEEARHVLDASLQAPLGGRLTLKLDAKNLSDAPYRVTQGSVIRHGYTAGRSFSAGLSWQP